jgi:DNA modification methylase
MTEVGATSKQMQNELRSIEDLRECPRNPRKISGEAIAGLKVSLALYGDISGIVWNRKNGELVAGHQRLKALKKLYGENLVLDGSELRAPTGESWPVRIVDWDEKTHLGALVAANNQAIAGEFTDELQGILQELKQADPDEYLSLCFGDLEAEFEKLVEKSATRPEPDDVPDEFPEAITKLGDMWRLGDHLLLCGDACSKDDVNRLMRGARAQMCFTDPPYNVAYEGAAGSIQNDDLGAKFEEFLLLAIENIIQKTDGACYIAMSSSELDTLQTSFRLAGGHWSTFIIWAKDQFTLGRSDYQRQYEPILYGWPKNAKRYWNGDRTQGDVWFCDRPRTSKLHPTMKPVELVVRAINNSSVAGERVLDLFGGSGTTLIASECTGRKARLMELDPRFCDVIVHRWERFTGRQAERLEND